MRKRCISLIITVGILCLAHRAAGYCLFTPFGSSTFYSWKTMPIGYSVSDNVTDPLLLKAIDDAFMAWEEVTCSTLDFTKESQFTMCTQTPCSANTVEFYHTDYKIHVFWFTDSTTFPASSSDLVDFYTYSNLNGDILGASIAINAFSKQWNATGGDALASIYDLQNEMTAFVGSVIGLTDSYVPGSTMFPLVMHGDTSKRDLSQDDIDGLVYIYQAPGCADPPAPGPDGCYTPPTLDGGATLDGGPTLDGGATLDGGPTLDGGVDATGGDASTTDLIAASDVSGSPDMSSALDAMGTSDGFSTKDGELGDSASGGDGGHTAQTADDGCCRASHGSDTSVHWVALLGLGLLLALRRRRG